MFDIRREVFVMGGGAYQHGNHSSKHKDRFSARSAGDDVRNGWRLDSQLEDGRTILLPQACADFVDAGPGGPIHAPIIVRRFFAIGVALKEDFGEHIILALISAQIVFQNMGIVENLI